MSEVIIKTTKEIKGLFSITLPPGEYEAGYNKHGAIFVKLPYGNTLGVKPGEFEFVKAPEQLLKQWEELRPKEYENIGKRILKALEIRNMTQRELAEKTGITEVTISRYAQSKRVPKGPEIVKIANVLNCTTDFILGTSDEIERQKEAGQ